MASASTSTAGASSTSGRRPRGRAQRAQRSTWRPAGPTTCASSTSNPSATPRSAWAGVCPGRKTRSAKRSRPPAPRPATQDRLLRALHATGKPGVLVLTTGSANAVEWAQQNLPAIVVGWYPGQQGGSAVADVLFGQVNPSGRLPVTFYKSVGQLPPFGDYDMKGRTYRYFQ